MASAPSNASFSLMESPLARLVLGLGGSAMLHVLAVLLLGAGLLGSVPSTEKQSAEDRVVSFEVIETPPPPEAPEPEPDSPPPPEPETAAIPPPVPKRTPAPLPEPIPAPTPEPVATPDASPPELPPPSSDPGAEPAEPNLEPLPLNVGISMRSTVGDGESGRMRVGIGSTLYGRPDKVARDPAEVKGYGDGVVPRGERAEPSRPAFIPPHRVSTLPRVRREVRAPYPEEARREGVEGRVVLRLRINEKGVVVEAEVLEGPGLGLDEAAREALMAFQFRPAMLDGDPVATELRYVYTFLLD